uniref:AlNc14C30G2844 protein n=1 Tax=Albugo laibachii Nc14 TaxID=890382 RepID=F0W7P0_9STRA|nr:AlNc14C30G2844 [Albugo laibachii Nc14]|eukprot:CCA17141.1 AlNc14C30G2844 [Albugo laibachii Nc14]
MKNTTIMNKKPQKSRIEWHARSQAGDSQSVRASCLAMEKVENGCSQWSEVLWHHADHPERQAVKRHSGGGSVMVWAAFSGLGKTELKFISVGQDGKVTVVVKNKTKRVAFQGQLLEAIIFATLKIREETIERVLNAAMIKKVANDIVRNSNVVDIKSAHKIQAQFNDHSRIRRCVFDSAGVEDVENEDDLATQHKTNDLVDRFREMLLLESHIGDVTASRYLLSE